MKPNAYQSIVNTDPKDIAAGNNALRYATIMILLVLIMLSFGLLMVYSTTSHRYGDTMFNKQLIWAGVGGVGAIAIVLLGPKRLTDWRLITFGLAVAWGLLLLARISPAINGAHRWIKFGSISIQPSEIAKFLCIILFARWAYNNLQKMPTIFGEMRRQTFQVLHRRDEPWWERPAALIGGVILVGLGAVIGAKALALDVFRFMAATILIVPGIWLIWRAGRSSKDYNASRYLELMGPPVALAVTLGLIYIGKDLGMTLLTAASAGVVMFAAGLRFYWVLFAAGLVTGGIWCIRFFPESYRYKRLFSFLDPEQAGDAGFQIWMSLVALGSGGLTGRGLGAGRMKTGYLPEDHTDCILSIAGEELGMIALLLLIIIFVLMLIMGALISINARNKCSMLLGIGFTAMLGIQMMINIAVITSSMPAKGMPAPFISYGGSNMVVSLMSIGVLFAIAVEAAFPDFHDRFFRRLQKILLLGKGN